jgi:dihydroorotate dehydrogenase
MLFKFFRNLLFLMSAETAHYVTLNTLQFALKIPFIGWLIRKQYQSNADASYRFVGIDFPNRVGLAAGFDKNAKYLDVMKALGFGHVEIGTVTPLPQPGNDKPRLFRLIPDRAIINRMGFNNDGVERIVERLKNRPKGLIVGGNIGKNKVTANELAVDDYRKCFLALYPHVDYFTVNVSSPNTPGLRALQDKGPLTEILTALMGLRKTFVENGHKQLPILLKIAPDLNQDQLNDIVALTLETGIDGIVATNTTIDRDGLTSAYEHIGAGGLSGDPVYKKSTMVLNHLNQSFEGKVPLIGVGGISSVVEAKGKLAAGAGLVQLYTGFIYEGPALVKACQKL